jgi:hypothetical protein
LDRKEISNSAGDVDFNRKQVGPLKAFMQPVELEHFLTHHMQQGGRYVPARLQASMALLERLREKPELSLDKHKKPNSSGLDSHETYGDRVHNRLQIEPINKNHGRRSSNIGGWGQELLDRLRDAGFASANASGQAKAITETQDRFGTILRGILDQEPIEARTKGRSVEAVVREILKQAEAKGKTGEVSQYLVAAKLQLRLKRVIAVVPSNKGDRKSRSDVKARTGDFEIENATIEVAVGLPDDKHLSQVAEALEDNDLEVWLITRHDRVPTWKHELGEFEGVDMRRVVVTSVDAFVGQNITELGNFSVKGKADQLHELFKLYNERWVAEVGTPGIRIIIK